MKMWMTAIAILLFVQPGLIAQQGPIARKQSTPEVSQKSQVYQWQPLVVKAHTIVAVGRKHLPLPFTLMPWMHPLKNRGLMYQSLLNRCQVLVLDFPASETDRFHDWISSFPKDQPIKGGSRPHIGASPALPWPKVRMSKNPALGVEWVYGADIIRGSTRARFLVMARSAPNMPITDGPPEVMNLQEADHTPQSPIYAIKGGYLHISIGFYPWQTASLPTRRSAGASLVSLWTTPSGQLDVKKAKAMSVIMVKNALAKGATVDARNQNRITTLIAACALKHMDIVNLLLASGANVNARGNEGENALLAAVGNAALVKLLLSHGADVNAKAADGTTPLLAAAIGTSVTTIKLLLSHGADVNAKDNSGGTALMEAVGFSRTDMVRLLLAHGADVNAKENAGDSALGIAKSQRNAPIIALLQSAVADHEKGGSKQ